MRMAERGGGASLEHEPLDGLCVFSDGVWEELEGYESTELGVLGFVHHAHPAPSELLDDSVMRDGLADHGQVPRQSYFC